MVIMSTPKSTSKSKKSQWNECDNCAAIFAVSDNQKHLEHCPSDPKKITHFFIKNQRLFGNLNVKNDEETEGLDTKSLDDFVFLNYSCMQLCGLSPGDWTVLEINNMAPIMKKVWLTKDKSLTSVHLTKKALDLYFGEVKAYPNVSIVKLTQDMKEALKVILKPTGSLKSIELNQILKKRLCNRYKGTILTNGNKIGIFFFGKLLKFSINEVISDNSDLVKEFENLKVSDLFYKVTGKTEWILFKDYDKAKKVDEKPPLSKVGGLSEEMKKIKMLMNMCLTKVNDESILKPSKSVLLYGNSGTGKTMLANALAKECNFKSFNALDFNEKYPAKPEETLRKIFEDAVSNGPSVIVLDRIDVMCPRGFSKLSDKEKRIFSTLLTLLDELQYNQNARVFIICTTNDIDNIDPCFRRMGRFDYEIEIPIPNSKARKDILEKILSEIEHNVSEDQLWEISNATHGFVGADLMHLCCQAENHAFQNSRKILDIDDFKFGLKNVEPSAMRKSRVEVPKVKWSDIGGQENLKLILKQAVEWPLKYPESFLRMGVTPPKGVLMYGPPGCSKTMIAKAVATESSLNFLSIKGPELFNKWVGESEKAVRELFRNARQVAPSVIFFDEIDAIGGERASGNSNSVQERVLAQLLTELDGVTPLGDVRVIAATNRPDKIDKALLRPGRFDRVVYVPLPDGKTRMEIFKLKLLKMPVQDVDIEILVESTENYSGAEINAVCNEAGMKAMEENSDVITMHHFEVALDIITPKTPEHLLQLYQRYASKSI